MIIFGITISAFEIDDTLHTNCIVKILPKYTNVKKTNLNIN